MATGLSIPNAKAIEYVDDLADSCDLGSTNPGATLKIYDGGVPPNLDTVLSGNTTLTSHAMYPATSGDTFGAAGDDNPGASADANAISDAVIITDGTASFYRIFDRDDTARIQGSVGTSDSSLIVDSVDFKEDATVSITSLTIAHGE